MKADFWVDPTHILVPGIQYYINAKYSISVFVTIRMNGCTQFVQLTLYVVIKLRTNTKVINISRGSKQMTKFIRSTSIIMPKVNKRKI